MKLYTAKIFVLLFIGVARAAVQVGEKNSVNVTCDLNVQYPTWTGPDQLVNPLTSGQTINEDGLEWVNNKDLKIVTAMLKHDGMYTCSDSNGNNKTVEVDVEYFSASAELTPASAENTTSVFTCICHSNPPCTITPVVVSHNTPGNVKHKTTFYPCAPNPSYENRTRCSVISTLGMAKEYNGLTENKCEYKYKDTENYAGISKANVFYFPPTNVSITAEKVGKTLTLNCSTDSSNPVASMNWFRGFKSSARDNPFVTSSYNKLVQDAEYNGKNVSESLDVKVDSMKKGEKVFCCAGPVNSDICDSLLLDPFREEPASGGYILSAWMAMVVVCLTINIL